jgi:hypothetical protein
VQLLGNHRYRYHYIITTETIHGINNTYQREEVRYIRQKFIAMSNKW